MKKQSISRDECGRSPLFVSLIPAANLAFATAVAELATLAGRYNRYSEIVAGSELTPEEQVVFDMLGDDFP